MWNKQPTPARKEVEHLYVFLADKDFESGSWEDLPRKHPCRYDNLPLTDAYFCPNLFSDHRRLRKNALPGRWLYADLDEVDPRELDSTLMPTIAWETSPGRYQAAWLLSRPLRPRSLERLNQAMTYATGADKGGWSLTKVLRFPGSISTKHGGSPFVVHLINIREESGPLPVYDPTDLRQLLPEVDTLSAFSNEELPNDSELDSYDQVYRRHRKSLSPRSRQLLQTRTLVGGDDRSAKLFELERDLLASQVPPADVFVLVRASIWNKYRGQNRERRAIWAEIQKIQASLVAEESLPPPSRTEDDSRSGKTRAPRLTSFRDFMTTPLPKPTWLVEGIWSESAHGVLAGEPKSLKSLFTLDLAVSIASGTPFLNHFAVPSQGPVIIIQEENAPGDVHDRLLRIASSRNLGPAVNTDYGDFGDTRIDFGSDLPLHLLNNEGFSLTDETWMKWLETQIRRIKPALVVLDPLYLMARGVDENSANEMTPILVNLLRLKQRYGCGIQIVHHYHKPKEGDKRRMAHRISGSGVFHRWLASAIYVERPDDSIPEVFISGEHRSHGNAQAYRVTFDLGSDNDLVYGVIVSAREKPDPENTEVDLSLPRGGNYDEVDDIPSTFDELSEVNAPIPLSSTAKALGTTSKELRRYLGSRGWGFEKLGRALHAFPPRRG